MSGFAGVWQLDGRTVQRNEIERLAGALPRFDGARATSWSSGPVGLVHRLFAVTPEDRLERQPWASRDGQRRLVFAGRLDGRAELAAALGIQGPDLHQMADGALCLTALERWDVDAPARLRGGFAFAAWDARAQRLLLCRDPAGERPLFYHFGGSFLAFATSYNALFALPQVPRDLDETIVGDMLALNMFEERRTFYRGVERVPSGAFLLCDRAGPVVRNHWQPQRRALNLKRHEDYVEAAREQLDRAVARALRSATPVCAQSSGGLDSSGVAATAARLLAPNRLAVYTRVPAAGFHRAETERLYFDEREKVEALAAMHPNMDVTFVDTGALHRFDRDAAHLFTTAGITLRNPDNLGWFSETYDRAFADGHRVMLSGNSGNFSLGWHGRLLLGQLARQGRIGELTRQMLALKRNTDRSAWNTLRQFVFSPLVPAAVRQLRDRLVERRGARPRVGFVDPDFARAHDIDERIAQIGGWQRELRQSGSFDLRLRWLVRANEIGRDYVGQMQALHGVEVRDPLGDPQLIEFCLNVPDEQYFHEGRPRALQRDAIADRVPPAITANYKFNEQLPEWFDRLTLQRDTMLADIERIARSPRASAMIDIKRLRAAAADWPADAVQARERENELRYGLTKALHIGRFICWFEGGNA